ncbi:hypothetical protein GCM10027594_11420 [Hymenobacter agri]
MPGGSPFASLEEARLEVAHYLDTYFNLDRHHSALGYRSPHQFEQDLKTNLPQLTVRFYWTSPWKRPRAHGQRRLYPRAHSLGGRALHQLIAMGPTLEPRLRM